MKKQKTMLLLKSDPLNQEQVFQLQSLNIQPTQLQLLQFQTKTFQLQQCDWVILHSVNAIQADWIQGQNYLVVGKKTEDKVKQLLNPKEIHTFDNQQQLTEFSLSLNRCNITCVIGNLSEVSEDLQKKHNVTIIEGYVTQFRKINFEEIDDKFDYVVYYSKSNYDWFSENKIMDEKTIHIFLGEKCANGHREKRSIVLKSPKFEELLNVCN